MREKSDFGPGDKVFAKVKGYPPWPAKVDNVFGKKYHVTFYGTRETAALKINELFDYVTHRNEFVSKYAKKKGFADSVTEIEEELESIGVTIDKTSKENSSSNSHPEGSSKNRKRALGDTSLFNDSVSEEGSESSLHKTKKPTIEDRKCYRPNENTLYPCTERAILNAADNESFSEQIDETEDDDEQTFEIEDSYRDTTDEKTHQVIFSEDLKVIIYNNPSDDAVRYKFDLFAPKEDKLDRILVARIPSGEYVGISIFADQPTEFESDYARQMFHISSARNALRFRHSLQTGEIDPETVKDKLIFDIKLTLEDELKVGEEYIMERKRDRLAWLKIESKLVQADSDIKSHLGLEKAEPEKALTTLENILTLNVEPLMLIKHPHILDMAKRLRRYIGNAKEWSMTESELSDFHMAAANIRDVANSVYQKFKNIFDTPPEKSFIDYFEALRKEYQDATKDLSETQKFSICSKPGSKQYFLDKKDAEEEIRLIKLREMIKKTKQMGANADAANSPELNQDFPMDEKETN